MRTFAQKQHQPQKQVSSSLGRSNTAPTRPNLHSHPLLHLQRTIGNQAVLRLLQAKAEEPEVRLTAAASSLLGHDFSRIPVFSNRQSSAQTRPSVNILKDTHDQEAARIAEQVIDTAEPFARTSQTAAGSPMLSTGDQHNSEAGSQLPATVRETLRASGRPLDPATRAFMEPKFGRDFGGVRIHTDAKAAESAKAVKARAYTAGQHVVMGASQPSPETIAGRHLLAHELAHVVQQSYGGPAPSLTRSAPHEHDAHAAAIAVSTGLQGVEITSHTGVGLARIGDNEPLFDPQTTPIGSSVGGGIPFYINPDVFDFAPDPTTSNWQTTSCVCIVFGYGSPFMDMMRLEVGVIVGAPRELRDGRQLSVREAQLDSANAAQAASGIIKIMLDSGTIGPSEVQPRFVGFMGGAIMSTGLGYRVRGCYPKCK